MKVHNIEPNKANPNTEAFMVYKKPRAMDKPVNCSINQVITPLSDKTNCHENALIVKLVQKGARIANRNKGRHFSLTQKTIKYAKGHATKPAMAVENRASKRLRPKAWVKCGVSKKSLKLPKPKPLSDVRLKKTMFTVGSKKNRQLSVKAGSKKGHGLAMFEELTMNVTNQSKLLSSERHQYMSFLGELPPEISLFFLFFPNL